MQEGKEYSDMPASELRAHLGKRLKHLDKLMREAQDDATRLSTLHAQTTYCFGVVCAFMDRLLAKVGDA